MRVLVCGGRGYTDWRCVQGTLNAIDSERRIHAIIHGAASGADRLGECWAGMNIVQSIAFPAKWREHGPAAGPLRNKQMIDEGKPDLVVAFPGGMGTANMVSQARAAGIEVMVVSGDTIAI